MWVETYLRDNAQCVMRNGQCFFTRSRSYARMDVAIIPQKTSDGMFGVPPSGGLDRKERRRLKAELQTYLVCGAMYFTTGSSANAASFSTGARPMINFDDCGSRITSKPSFFNCSIVAADLSESQT